MAPGKSVRGHRHAADGRPTVGGDVPADVAVRRHARQARLQPVADAWFRHCGPGRLCVPAVPGAGQRGRGVRRGGDDVLRVFRRASSAFVDPSRRRLAAVGAMVHRAAAGSSPYGACGHGARGIPGPDGGALADVHTHERHMGGVSAASRQAAGAVAGSGGRSGGDCGDAGSPADRRDGAADGAGDAKCRRLLNGGGEQLLPRVGGADAVSDALWVPDGELPCRAVVGALAPVRNARVRRACHARAGGCGGVEAISKIKRRLPQRRRGTEVRRSRRNKRLCRSFPRARAGLGVGWCRCAGLDAGLLPADVQTYSHAAGAGGSAMPCQDDPRVGHGPGDYRGHHGASDNRRAGGLAGEAGDIRAARRDGQAAGGHGCGAGSDGGGGGVVGVALRREPAGIRRLGLDGAEKRAAHEPGCMGAGAAGGCDDRGGSVVAGCPRAAGGVAGGGSAAGPVLRDALRGRAGGWGRWAGP